VPDARWGEAVTAVVRVLDGGSVDATSLAAFCRERLAGYKCPKSYHRSEAPLPKNANGKLLRRVVRDDIANLSDL
jgi:acyl-CoA synthetase (AMP-forming)/AMP-acid ligase II